MYQTSFRNSGSREESQEIGENVHSAHYSLKSLRCLKADILLDSTEVCVRQVQILQKTNSYFSKSYNSLLTR